MHSGAIEVPLALARVVGLAAALDSDTYLSVRVEPAGFVPTASRVCLEPLSSDDWEILEANAEHLEGQMLTQVRVHDVVVVIRNVLRFIDRRRLWAG